MKTGALSSDTYREDLYAVAWKNLSANSLRSIFRYAMVYDCTRAMPPGAAWNAVPLERQIYNFSLLNNINIMDMATAK